MTNDAQSAEDAQLVLGDGRRLGYAQYGQPEGEPIMYFHGIRARARKHASPTKQRRQQDSG
jgi:hypothetical protein